MPTRSGKQVTGKSKTPSTTSKPTPVSTPVKDDEGDGVQHGSSAQGLEQEKENKGDEGTPVEGNPSDPAPMDTSEQGQDQDQEQEEDKGKEKKEEKEKEKEDEPQVTKMITTMLSHMSMLGAQLNSLTEKMKEMEDRERLRRNNQIDSPSTSLAATPPKSEQQKRRARSDSTQSTSHNTNLALTTRSNFAKKKYPNTPFVRQSREYSTEIEGQEIRSREHH